MEVLIIGVAMVLVALGTAIVIWHNARRDLRLLGGVSREHK